MPFWDAKVYFDGSHYIAIPHTVRYTKKRPNIKPIEETIIVEEMESSPDTDELSVLETETSNFNIEEETEIKELDELQKDEQQVPKKVRISTKKQLFEELYAKYIDLKKRECKSKIIADMLPYFDNYEHTKSYVEINFDRKIRNLICRRVRMTRKANLANFNYFCTFTYDSSKHTEETFRKKLRGCFKMMCHRRNWKYMGVWERAPETDRLHFHGLFNIPDNSLPGELKEVSDYDTRAHKMRTTFQSTYFNEKFGRSDFKEIDERENRIGNALAYLMKYMEKTGERIVYSKNLPQYFISDIMDDDIVCTIGQEDKKLLLFDDFKCWDEGVLMGTVSPEVIEQMRKAN